MLPQEGGSISFLNTGTLHSKTFCTCHAGYCVIINASMRIVRVRMLMSGCPCLQVSLIKDLSSHKDDVIMSQHNAKKTKLDIEIDSNEGDM